MVEFWQGKEGCVSITPTGIVCGKCIANILWKNLTVLILKDFLRVFSQRMPLYDLLNKQKITFNNLVNVDVIFTLIGGPVFIHVNFVHFVLELTAKIALYILGGTLTKMLSL